MKNFAHRLTAFVLTLVLLVTAVPAMAAAQSGLAVSVHWIDGSGQVRHVPALPVADGSGEGYWATLDAALMGEYLSAEVTAYGSPAGETTFQWVQDAGFYDPAYAQYIPYAAGGENGELMLYVSSQPLPVDGVDYKSGYGYVDASSVNLREGPSTSHDKIASVKEYGYCQILGAEKSGGYTWFYVGINGVYGYLRADNFEVMSESRRNDFLNSSEYEEGVRRNSHLNGSAAPERTEAPVITEPPVQETDPVYEQDPMTAFGYVDATSVNLREGPSTRYDAIGKFYTYALVNVLGSDVSSGDTWYLVEYNGQVGYLHGDYVQVLRESELERFLNSDRYEAGIRNNTTPEPATDAPVTEPPVYTDVPVITDAPDPLTAFGYVDASSVNMREGPSTRHTIIAKLYTYALVNVLGSERASDGDTWYQVSYNGQTGYLHGDYVRMLKESELDEFLNSAQYEAGIRNNTTPEPVITEVPVVTDVPAAPVYVPVYYYAEDGTLLDEQWKSYLPGTQRVTPDSSKVNGLTLISEAAVTVTVYADGTASPASVTFLYEAAQPTQAPTNPPKPDYKSGFGYVTASSVNVRTGPSTKDDKIGKFEHYVLCEVLDSTRSGGDVWYQVTARDVTGWIHGDYLLLLDDADLAAFKETYEYQKVNVPAQDAQILVYYMHVDNTQLDVQTRTYEPGTHTVRADSAVVKDFVPVGSEEVTITVSHDGIAEPASVTFWYEDAPVLPVEAEVTVEYRLESGELLDALVQFFGPGEHPVYASSTKVEGLTLVGESYQSVYVTAEGKASPNPVVFTYRKPMATVTVHYQDDRSRDVAPAHVLTLEDGTHTITASPEGLDDTWELAPGVSGQAEVLVDRGIPSVKDVYFYYQQKQQKQANITVHYYDTEGNPIASEQIVTRSVGVHAIKAEPVDLPEGYELVSEATLEVEVFANGTFAPQEVAFYYRPVQQAPKTADVTVFYKDDLGRDVATAQVRTLENGKHTIYPAPDDLKADYILFPGTDESMEVVVRNGVPSKAEVTFYYQYVQPEPTVFGLPVYYYDTLGNPIADPQYIKVPAGTYPVNANPVGLPEGCELMSEAPLFVTVNADGTTDPEEIAFYYRMPEKKAKLEAYILDAYEEHIIAGPYTVELAPGSHQVQVDADRVPSSHDAATAQTIPVIVTREGKADPATLRFYVEPLVTETPIPVGEPIYRYATVQSNRVAFRNEPSTKGNETTVIRRFSKGDAVYVMQELYNDKGELWAMLNVDGRIGYMGSSYLKLMTQEESDRYAQKTNATTLPTFTPVPTATPTEAPTPTEPQLVEIITAPPAITGTPTLEPLPGGTETATPTATPTASPTPAPYIGYALTTRSTALRTGVSNSELSVIQTMEANELVLVSSQLYDGNGDSWSIVTTLRGQAGYMRTADLRYISDEEAQPYLDWWDEVNATAQPTEYASPTPEPMQMKGYALTVGDNVPFRQMASEFSRIIDNLPMGEVVYISGQNYVDGVTWHSVTYDSRWGYIRSDMVRMMTIAEEEDYLDSLNKPAPTMATTNRPFDENGLSSYGYVDASSVYFREGPSTSDRRIGELKRYAFCLVRGTETVGGQTWYQVSYGGKTGYVHGDYLHQMTIAELEDFLGSEEYRQGIVNNSETGSNAEDDVGFTGTGGLVSPEDQTVNQWQNSLPQVSFQPFNPIGTVQPIVTLEPLPGNTATEAPTATPSPTPTFDPLPNVTYPTTEPTGSGGSMIVWGVVIGLLIIAVGGVFFIVQYQQKRRRIALRAAQRRAQAARAAQLQQRPYAGQQGQPRSATRAPEAASGTVRRPAARAAEDPNYRPYARPEGQPYGSYGQDGGTGAAGRTGRRADRHRAEDQGNTEEF